MFPLNAAAKLRASLQVVCSTPQKMFDIERELKMHTRRNKHRNATAEAYTEYAGSRPDRSKAAGVKASFWPNVAPAFGSGLQGFIGGHNHLLESAVTTPLLRELCLKARTKDAGRHGLCFGSERS